MLKSRFYFFTGMSIVTCSILFGIIQSKFNNLNGQPKNVPLPGAIQYETSATKQDILLFSHPISESDAVATFRIKIPSFSPVDLYITDKNGVRIRNLLEKYLPAGTYEISWYGETDLDTPLAPGEYFANLHSRGKTQTLKVSYFSNSSPLIVIQEETIQTLAST